MDLYLDAMPGAAERQHERPAPGLPAPVGFQGSLPTWRTASLTSLIDIYLSRYSLKAAAGKFGKRMPVEPEGWVGEFLFVV